MAKKPVAAGRPQPLELTPVEALLQMKQELDEDIEYMGQSIQTLKGERFLKKMCSMK